MLQKAFREAARTHCTVLRTCRHLFYLPISFDLSTHFKCNCQTRLVSFILWYRGEKITHYPLRLAVAEITQGHISKAKFKSSRSPLLELLSPISDVFGGAQHLCQNSSTLTSAAIGVCEHSQTSRPIFPRVSGQVLSEPGRRWWCHLQSPGAVGSSGITAHSQAAGDHKSQLYWMGPDHFHHSLRWRIAWYKERGGREKKSYSGWKCAVERK